MDLLLIFGVVVGLFVVVRILLLLMLLDRHSPSSQDEYYKKMNKKMDEPEPAPFLRGEKGKATDPGEGESGKKLRHFET